MTRDNEFVLAAYVVTAIAVAALVLWAWLDQRARKAELADLEARGIRRRSAGVPQGEGAKGR